ncbi:hypothetical protein [Knoellia aerolata]|uniref:Uncharacterized protein n=1 Tax=Knoellia aerolata DSM 18566 TaxID=1385519 RepID=A0A0A0K1F4_9MICO|nr:hypothetical protein [Knoellia aerolata]KGN41616.1 hypothetical protein N801_18360 [Knoellia aerolata DSM 18566]
MGKHESSRTTGRVTVIAAVAAIAVLVGGTWAVASLMEEDPGTAGSRPLASASASASASATATASATPSASPTASSPEPSATASATVDAAAAQSAERHAKCVAEVASATRLANAVATSATHWRQHVAAQLAWDARTQSFATTKAQWAASRAFGPADEREFAAATQAAGASKGACAAAVSAAPPVAATTACASRLKALESAVATGTVVHRQWSAHLLMMQQKEHADMGAYHRRWIAMVRDAQAPLRTHAAAAAAVGAAPACA